MNTDTARHPSGGGQVVLALEGVSKSFGEIVANRDVCLTLEKGEVRGLVGENGAGKSTLAAIVSGVYRPDAGRMSVNGRYHRFATPNDALEAGVSMVHQHPMLVANLTVTQNVALGATRRRWLFHRRAIEDALMRLGDKYGLAVQPQAKVAELSPPDQQRAEILIALYADSSIIILDEPTAILPPADIARLSETIRGLAKGGKTVIFISHKLDEVLRLADRVTVMRRGSIIDTIERRDADVTALATSMVGSEVPQVTRGPPGVLGPSVFRAIDLSVPATGRRMPVKSVTLAVSAGEVLGVAGVDGNGQPELIEALAGLRRTGAGRIEFEDDDVTGCGAEILAKRGMGHIPEDRRTQGLALPMSVAWNIGLRHFETSKKRRWSVDYLALRRLAEDAIEAFDIREATPDTPVGDLSGGNQQKVMLARELGTKPKLLLVSNPSTGLDVRAAAFVHDRLFAARDEGCAIIVVSSDLDELLLLSDRIVVMYRGQIVGESGRPFSRQSLGLLMSGVGARSLEEQGNS